MRCVSCRSGGLREFLVPGWPKLLELRRHDPGQQLVDAVDWVVGDAFQYMAQICLRVDPVELGRLCRPPNYAESGPFPQISG